MWLHSCPIFLVCLLSAARTVAFTNAFAPSNFWLRAPATSPSSPSCIGKAALPQCNKRHVTVSLHSQGPASASSVRRRQGCSPLQAGCASDNDSYSKRSSSARSLAPADRESAATWRSNPVLSKIEKFTRTALCIGLASTTLVLGGAPARALTEPQMFVAEAWKTVDSLYYDRTFNGVDWFQLRQSTIDKAKNFQSDEELYTAVADMVSQLGDKYTRFLTPTKYETLVEYAKGELAGLGVSISLDDELERPTISSVEDNTPASAAGVKPGDVMVTIDGTDTKGLTTDDAAALIRGPRGTKVGIVVQRDGKNIDFILTRENFKIQSVKPYMANIGSKRVGVIRIKSFSAGTAQDVTNALASFRKDGRLDEVVIDLRGNVGGLLPGGVDTARIFLNSGLDIVSTISKQGRVETQSTTISGPETSVPLILLVDGNTASSSEVFSAAIKENGRGKLVGSKTFGKGIIQTVAPLTHESGVAVTIAAYETPKHNNINKVGIPVDVELTCPMDKTAADCLPASLL